MGNGRNISPAQGNQPPRVPGEGQRADTRAAAPGENAEPRNNKANAPQLLDREWRSRQAANLRNNLSAMMAGAENKAPGRGNDVSPNAPRAGENAPNPRHTANAASTNPHHTADAAPAHARQTANNTTATPERSASPMPDNGRNAGNNAPVNNSGSAPNAGAPVPENSFLGRNTAPENSRQSANDRQIPRNYFAAQSTERERNSFAPRQPERAQNLLNQSWESLVARAKDHRDLAQFRAEPKEFWDDVRRMSEVRVVETFAGGKPVPRAVSRYGELLDKFNRQGGRLENFLASLPPGERAVFQARHQIHRIFGAHDLFVGNGVALDKDGRFPARVFFASNDKSPELAPHAILSLLNGKTSDVHSGDALNAAEKQIFAFFGGKNPDIPPRALSGLIGGGLSAGEAAFLENILLRAGGQILFSANSAALLGLSLALYQNLGAAFSLQDLAAEFFLPKSPDAFSPKILHSAPDKAWQSSQNTFDSSKISDNGARRRDDPLAAGALISGALATAERSRKTRGRGLDAGGHDSSRAGSSFAAGSTGALMGATVGCVVPLAEKSIGEILGFAASVVVGLTDDGLRALGANTLVAVVAGGVQSFLDASSADRTTLAAASPNKFLNEADVFGDDLERRLNNRRVMIPLPS